MGISLLQSANALNSLKSKFEPVNLETASFIPKDMTRAYRNRKYIVTVYDNKPVTTGTAILAMIQRIDATIIENHWSEIQKIKNELFGEESIAIEYYPAHSQLIDRHNIYWIWIYPA